MHSADVMQVDPTKQRLALVAEGGSLSLQQRTETVPTEQIISTHEEAQ